MGSGEWFVVQEEQSGRRVGRRARRRRYGTGGSDGIAGIAGNRSIVSKCSNAGRRSIAGNVDGAGGRPGGHPAAGDRGGSLGVAK